MLIFERLVANAKLT